MSKEEKVSRTFWQLVRYSDRPGSRRFAKRCGSPFLLCLLALLAQSASGLQELSFRSNVEASKEPLTTENAWKLDPVAQNPHRRSWVLHRRVQLVELKAVRIDGTYFRPSLEGISSEVAIHLRTDPRRYAELSSFPCTKNPIGPFATQHGALQAAEQAAKLWNQALAAARDDLAVRLGRIRADGPEKTLRIAEFYFKQWQRDVEERWAAKVDERSRQKEWQYYLRTAQKAGLCKTGKKPKAAELRWRDVIEPATAKAPAGELLVRVPARRWNGVFSVRGTVEVGGLRLNGQFILDTSSPRSMLSPSWLEGQGMNPQVLEAFSQGEATIRWIGGTSTGKRVVVDSLEISSYPFDLDEFYLIETKVFLPPDSVSPCCDGVLGRDFLMHHPIEFNPGAERDFVRIFARSGFTLAAKTPWVETAVDEGALVSQCTISGAQGKPSAVAGLSWLTASSKALVIDAEIPHAEGWENRSASIRCGETGIIDAVRADVRKGLPMGQAAGAVGMGILGRGPFTLDLPHGRIWFSEDALKRDVEANRSGLVLDFKYEKGQRMLRVKEILPRTPVAGTLLKEGVKPGARILEINGKEASDLDLWHANRFLTGVKGERVTLKIARKDADKLVPITVR